MKTADKNVQDDLGLNVRPAQGQSIPIRHCYHGFSDGSRSEVLFPDKDGFAQAINKLAVTVYEYDIILLAYCLMDNHFHFILYGEECTCELFLKEYARRICRNSATSAKDIIISLKPLDNDVYLKTAICYVLRNPVIARLPFQAIHYPYSSGFLLFTGKENIQIWSAPGWRLFLTDLPQTDSEILNGRFGNMPSGKICRINSLTYREKRQLTGSHILLPGEWWMADGIVFPGHFVNYSLCEKIFGTIRSFHFFMSTCREADFEQSQGALERLSIPDQEMRVHRDEMIHTLFGKFGVRYLSAQQRGLLARKMKYNYGCSPKQIARLVHLDIEQVIHLLK